MVFESSDFWVWCGSDWHTPLRVGQARPGRRAGSSGPARGRAPRTPFSQQPDVCLRVGEDRSSRGRMSNWPSSVVNHVTSVFGWHLITAMYIIQKVLLKP